MHIDKVYKLKREEPIKLETPTQKAIRQAHYECREIIQEIYPDATITNVYLSIDIEEVSVYYTLMDLDGENVHTSVRLPIEESKLTGCSSFELLLEPKSMDYLIKEGIIK